MPPCKVLTPQQQQSMLRLSGGEGEPSAFEFQEPMTMKASAVEVQVHVGAADAPPLQAYIHKGQDSSGNGNANGPTMCVSPWQRGRSR